ncbi:MAG TPA: M14 family metallopeptidase, partial [Sphingomicrobium sp.]|nr:M14 family metallopeptidase [Sphingomicrobium sp.]
ALQIGVGGGCPAVQVLILSGAHAREWGGPDICINFAADLLKAYTGNSGLTYQGKSFSASEIGSIVKRLKVIVFPDLNPDGRNFSQTSYSMWRKNRNPASSTAGQPATIGVDVNRNYGFLWDFPTAFAPGATAGGTLASTSPGSDIFHGTAPFSEPETRNVRWLFKLFPNIVRFVDIHSYGGDILHPWGDDENQTSDSSKSFTNAAWNGQRGLIGDAYREYITQADLSRLVALGSSMRASISAVRGENYSLAQSFFLPSWPGPSYPTSGCSDDWAFSRRYLSTRAGTFAFTIEFNRIHSFFPTWTEMEPIIREISAGLVQFSLDAVPRWRPWIWCVILQWFYKLWRRVWPWDLWGPYGPWERPLVEDIRPVEKNTRPG